MRLNFHGWITRRPEPKSNCRFLLIALLVASCSLSTIHARAAGTIGDSDGDGVPDIVDIDDDNDTIPDDEEGTADRDGDGIMNCLDLDSDNDGIPDLFEAISSQSLLRLLDADGNGEIDASVAVGNNGLADLIEDVSDSGITRNDILDTDFDGVPDHYDLDADNDGIPDVIEAGSSDTDRDGQYDLGIDLNGDGLADRLYVTPIVARDTDQDGVLDFRDIDSDQDGLTDLLETAGVDTDNDGRVDDFKDNNVDGLDDAYMNQNRGYPDTDQDGFPDYRDTDSDNDGVSDAEEAFSGSVASQPIVPTSPFNPRPMPSAQPAIDTLETGESGSVFGCSTATRANDPLLLILFVLAALGLFKRMRLKSTHLARVSIMTMVAMLSACAAQPRPYVGVGLGASFLNANTTNLSLVQDQSFSAAGQVTLGTTIGQRFAIEGRAADLGEATFTNGLAVGYQVADVSGLFRQRFGNLSAYGRVGAGALFNDGDIRTTQKNPTHLVVGAGVDYSLTPRLAVRAEWQGHDADVMHGQLSVLYRFNTSPARRPIVVVSNEPPAEMPTEPVTAQVAKIPATVPVEQAPVVRSVPKPLPVPVPTPVAPLRGEPIADWEAPKPGLKIDKLPEQQLAIAETSPIPVKPSNSGRLKPLVNIPAPKKITPRRVDSDKDGIVDASDKCSNTTVGTAVLANGCSFFGESVPGLSFFPETDRLTAKAKEVLDTVADALSDKTDLGVTVAAHTAPADDAKAAMFLTRRRTIAIIRYLSDKGIDATRLRPEAFGDTQPMADVTDPSENDRVVLTPR